MDYKELIKAAEWLAIITSTYECFGGYPNGFYFIPGHIIILEPGNESSKYAHIDFYKNKDVVEEYRKSKKKDYDGIDNFIPSQDLTPEEMKDAIIEEVFDER